MANSGRLEVGDNIYGYYKSISITVTYLARKAIEFGENAKRAITPFKVIQVIKVGTNRKPVCDLLLAINSN